MKKPMAARVLRFGELEQMYARIASAGPGRPFFQAMLDGLNVEWQLDDAELAKIPSKGPCVVVANHPFGLLEGAAILSKLLSLRDDVRALTNEVIATVPEVKDWFIPVDVFSGAKAAQANQRGLRRAFEWLKAGGLLVVFPAGEVSHLQWNRLAITDPEWNSSVARLIRRTGAAAVPVYIHGANSALFQVLGLLHSKVRTALLPHEFLNKKRRRLDIRIGRAIPAHRAAAISSDEALTRYLRWRTYLLSHRREPRPAPRVAPPNSVLPQRAIHAEVERLSASRLLVESGDTQVFVAPASEIPMVLDEIGLLREAAFRAVGEGTGKERDLDEFDGHYLHLFSWDRARREVIGAYRLGQTDEILRRHSLRGLYTSTLFHYSKDLLLEIHPALELGRSFVRAEHQRNFASLLLLWKGIGRFVVAHPRYRVLFGPVSISNDYGPLSRRFLVSYLEANARDERLSRLVRPRKPYRRLPLRHRAAWGIELEELSEIIADLEPDGKGIPVLLRQYLKLGGKLLAFNVDPKFSRCLDGLIVVDLAATGRAILNRYMGAPDAESFLRYHRALVA
jgi:putative hemolysin